MVLVVDDDRNVRDTIRDLLQLEDIPAVVLGPDLDVDAVFASLPIRVVVTDLNMPHCDGLEVMARVARVAAARGVRIPVYLLTGAGGEGRLDDALKMGAAGFFPKPFDLDSFTATLRKELEGAEA